MIEGDAAQGGVAQGATIEGVLFDVDDTLVDTRVAFSHAIVAVSRAFLPELPVERYREVLARWRADPGGHYRQYTAGKIGFDTQRMLRAQDLQATFGGPDLDESGYAVWKELFWGTFERSWVAHEDVMGVLDSLACAGVKVGAVSNASVALQTAKLAAIGVGDRVPLLVGLDTLGVGKPAPEVFLEGCRLLGTEPIKTAYVGDERDIDAGGADAAGLVGVWLDRPGTRRVGAAEDDGLAQRKIVVVRGLDELVGALGIGSDDSARARSADPAGGEAGSQGDPADDGVGLASAVLPGTVLSR